MTKLAWYISLSLLSSLTLAQSPGTTQPASQPASQPACEAKAPAPFLDIIHNDRVTGDWGGVRPKLEGKGITLDLHLVSIFQDNLKGGLSTHNAHQITGKADTELTLDTAAMGLWKGGTFYTFAESGWADSITGHVGSLSELNTDAIGDMAARVRVCWYEQKFLNDKVRFKFGKLDLAADFDTNAYANWEVAQFLNSSLVNTGTFPLPEYGLGALVSVQPTDWMYISLGSGDAQANANETGFRTTFHDEPYFFNILETGFQPVWQTKWGKLPGTYRFIVWYDPQPKEKYFDDLGGRRRTIPFKNDDLGFIFNMDQLIFKEHPKDDGDEQGLGVFFRYGHADGRCNQVEDFWSVGAQYQGLVPNRNDDVLGFGFSQAILSRQLRNLSGGDRESVYELYYNCQVLPWLHISPDFQYIVHPGADKSVRDALVAGLRVVMAF